MGKFDQVRHTWQVKGDSSAAGFGKSLQSAYVEPVLGRETDTMKEKHRHLRFSHSRFALSVEKWSFADLHLHTALTHLNSRHPGERETSPYILILPILFTLFYSYIHIFLYFHIYFLIFTFLFTKARLNNPASKDMKLFFSC